MIPAGKIERGERKIQKARDRQRVGSSSPQLK
jgi:hypothetical protein